MHKQHLLFALFLALHPHTSFADPPAPIAQDTRVREVEVIVDRGYQPSRITARVGERLRLRFVRRDYSPCSAEVVFASLGLRRTLPVGEAVLIDLPPIPREGIEFRCGMNMLRGVIEVTP